ncbi:MAG: histidine phosphatase family protein [Vicinamibacteria bacterium]
MGDAGTLELWLVRHGETPASRGQTLAGWTDVPLTEVGEREAETLRPILAGEAFAGVWSSDLQRTIATARLAWGEPCQDPRLREIHFGELEGRHWPTLEPAHRKALERFEGLATERGETFEAVRGRVVSFLASLTPGRHLVFTHGGIVRLLSRETGHDEFVATGTLLVLDWTGRRLVSRRSGGFEAWGPAPAE